MADPTGTVSVVSNLSTSASPTGGHGLTYELVVGIVANILTVVVVVVVLALWEFGVKRRRLFKFFGLAQEKTLRIFIGHIPHDAVPQGLVGFEESSAALRLAELFESPIPGLSDTPGF